MKNRVKFISNKVVSAVTILTLLTYILINFINEKEVQAVQYTEAYNASKIVNYPGYKELIETMKIAHPNWNFTIFYTGLNWNDVIEAEKTHGRNVVPSSRSSEWKCSICGETPHGGSTWRCASEAAISYYMDPRNWINDTYIFQFETLSYNESTQKIEGVQKIIANMGYMQKNTYTKTDGTQATLSKSYAQIIIEAAKEANISPYHLAARLKQEQGVGSNPGSTATGTYSGYVGYYNFMNINATGAKDAEVIKKGLEYAKVHGWTDPEKSIKEGAKILAKNYINDGADTIYLQKFDVDNSDNTLYYFQYMQNVSVCLTEGTTARKTYEELGFINETIDFRIPVYENMPSIPCREPIAKSIVTQNVKIKGNKVRIRSTASTESDNNIIEELNAGYTLLRIEKANSAIDRIYWDKVVLPDGRKGYVAQDYLEEIADITNCNESVVTTTGVYLRNGPGTDETAIILLNAGEKLTRIEKNQYNLNGYVWDRVKLPDGRQGYIAQNYIKSIEPNNKFKLENEKLICEPETTIETIKEKNNGKQIITKNSKGEVINSGNIGTGYTITIDNKIYTVVKLGDVNGDGDVDTIDSLKALKQFAGTENLKNEYSEAADIDKDGVIDTLDSLKMLKKYATGENIELK